MFDPEQDRTVTLWKKTSIYQSTRHAPHMTSSSEITVCCLDCNVMQSNVNSPCFLTNLLKMEAVRFFEALINICQITRRYNPRNILIYSHSRDSVNSDNKIYLKIENLFFAMCVFIIGMHYILLSIDYNVWWDRMFISSNFMKSFVLYDLVKLCLSFSCLWILSSLFLTDFVFLCWNKHCAILFHFACVTFVELFITVCKELKPL
jgi:hypothetical protein